MQKLKNLSEDVFLEACRGRCWVAKKIEQGAGQSPDFQIRSVDGMPLFIVEVKFLDRSPLDEVILQLFTASGVVNWLTRATPKDTSIKAIHRHLQKANAQLKVFDAGEFSSTPKLVYLCSRRLTLGKYISRRVMDSALNGDTTLLIRKAPSVSIAGLQQDGNAFGDINMTRISAVITDNMNGGFDVYPNQHTNSIPVSRTMFTHPSDVWEAYYAD